MRTWRDHAPAIAGFALAALWATLCFDMEPGHDAGLLPCYFHAWTHLHCPACGGQRAVHFLLHGDLPQALHCNLLFLLFLPALLLTIWQRLRGLRPSLLDRIWIRRAVAVTVLLFGIVRNLPFWPCALLAPPG